MERLQKMNRVSSLVAEEMTESVGFKAKAMAEGMEDEAFRVILSRWDTRPFASDCPHFSLWAGSVTPGAVVGAAIVLTNLGTCQHPQGRLLP